MFGLGSSSQLGIGIAIKLHDQFSGSAARINQQLKDMQKNVGNSALNSAASNYRNNAAGIAVAAAGMSVAMLDMAKSGAKFQHTINMASMLGGGEKGKLKDWATQFSKEFINSPQEFAETMLNNARAGVDKGMGDIVKYQAAVATATGEQLAGDEGVGAKLLGIVAGYGLKATEIIDYSGKKMTQFARVANGVTAAANATQASVYSIGESMEYMANSGQLAGVSLERALSMVGMLAQAKIHGSAAGTAIANAIDMLGAAASPLAGPKKLKALGMLGVDPGQLRAMMNAGKGFEALEYVSNASKRLPQGDRLNLLKEVFNRRGGRGIITAFMEGGDKSMGSIRKEIEQGIMGDIALKQARKATDDLQGNMTLLSNSFARFKIAFTDAVGPTLGMLMRFATGFMNVANAILSTPIGKVIAGVVAVTVPLIAVMFGFRAAVLTAAIALRGFSTVRSIGGFGGIMGGMMGGIGSARMGGAAGLVTANSAGRMTVAAGQSINWAGKAYKGGQILPAAYLASMGLGGGAGVGGAAGVARGAALAGKAGTFFSSAGGILTKSLGFAGRLIPMVGTVWMLYEVGKSIWDILKHKNDEPPKIIDPIGQLYNRNLEDMYYSARERSFREGKLGFNKKDGIGLNQTLQVNIDGMSAVSQNLQSVIAMQEARNMNSKLDFTMPDLGTP
jgi:TP901 family phage tail tape measure protein